MDYSPKILRFLIVLLLFYYGFQKLLVTEFEMDFPLLNQKIMVVLEEIDLQGDNFERMDRNSLEHQEDKTTNLFEIAVETRLGVFFGSSKTTFGFCFKPFTTRNK